MTTETSLKQFFPPLIVYLILLNFAFTIVIMQLNRTQVNFIYQEAAAVFGFEYPLTRVIFHYTPEAQASLPYFVANDKQLNFFKTVIALQGCANVLLVALMGVIFFVRGRRRENMFSGR